MEITEYKKPPDCKGCPLYSHAHVPYSKGVENEYVIVAQSPGRDEIIAQRPLVGASGQLWNKILAKVGINREHFFIANALRCFEGKPPPSQTDINKAISMCKTYLNKALVFLKPRIIIVSGTYALKAVLNKEKITDKRGKMYFSPEYNCPVFVTLHPAAVLRECAKEYPNQQFEMMSMREKDYLKDWQSIAQLLVYMKENVDTDIYWETTTAGTLDTTKFMCKIDTSGYKEGKLKSLKTFSKSNLSLDAETVSASANASPLSIAYSVKEGESHVYKLGDKLEEEHQTLIESPNNKIVAGRPFDENLLKKFYGVDMGGKKYDVLTMAHILDENYYQYNLENVAALYADMKDIKSLAEGMRTQLSLASWETVIDYNGVDSDSALKSFNKMMNVFNQEPRLLNYLDNFMIPVQDMQAEIAGHGCKLNKKIYYESVVKLTEEMHRMEDDLIKRIPEKIRAMPIHQPKRNGESKLKLSRDALIRDIVFTAFKCKPNPRHVTAKNKLPQVTKEHLKDFIHIGWIKDYLDWAEIDKLYTSYLAPLDNYIKTGCYVMPSTSMIRTVTGRTAMLNPPIQTYPVRSKWSHYIRDCFVPDKGFQLGSRDLSQSELRIAGWLANDTNILKAIRNGIDLHTMTAAIMNDIPIEKVTKEMRQKAKPINFGLIYGLSALSLQAYLWEEYDLRVPIEECERIHSKFFSYPNGYYGLLNLYEKVKSDIRTYGYVESVLGRRRRFPMAKNSTDYLGRIERQAINFPIQSFSSDLALISMMLFWRAIKKYGWQEQVKPMWFIHDSIIFQATRKRMKDAMELLRNCMENLAPKYIKKYFGVTLGYPVESEGKIGKSWSEI